MRNLTLGTVLIVLFLFSVFSFHHDFSFLVLDEQVYLLALSIAVGWHLPKVQAGIVLTLGAASTLMLPYFNDPYHILYDYRFIFAGWFILLAYALYRSLGTTFVVILVTALLFGYFGYLIPGPLQAVQNNPVSLTEMLMFDNTAMLGIAITIFCGTVSIFVLMGVVFREAGITDILTNKLLSWLGSSKGGAAKVSVAASCAFGSFSGATVANVVTTGTVTIPLMIKAGLKRYQAAAIEAVSSTTSQVLPPVMGAAAFLMASMTATSYIDIAIAAIIPGVLLVISLMMIAHFIPADRIDVVANESRLKKPDWRTVVMETANQSTSLLMLSGTIGIVIGVMDQTGLSFKLATELLNISETYNISLLLMTAVVCIVLGFGMPTAAAYLIVALLVAPSLIEYGYDLIASHMFILYWCSLAMITPPVALGTFTAATIAEADQYKAGYWAMIIALPFMVISFLFMWFPWLLI